MERVRGVERSPAGPQGKRSAPRRGADQAAAQKDPAAQGHAKVSCLTRSQATWGAHGPWGRGADFQQETAQT